MKLVGKLPPILTDINSMDQKWWGYKNPNFDRDCVHTDSELTCLSRDAPNELSKVFKEIKLAMFCREH